MTEPRSDYDVVVVGGGAAGLSGALVLGRARRSVLVLDAGHPRNAPADGVHAFFTREGTPPTELLALGREQLAPFDVDLVEATAVSAAKVDGGFRVGLADGRTVRGRRLLVTTGLTDRLPDVTGLRERWGRDVVHCPYCHGWEVRDRLIAVLATGPQVLHQAGLFRQLSDRVVILNHAGVTFDATQTLELDARGIAVVEGRADRLVVEDDRLTGVRLADGRLVACEALAVATTMVANSAVLTDLGLAAEPHFSGMGEFVPSGADGVTSVPGLYLAGNVTDLRAQVIVAAAAAVNAAAMINYELVVDDTAAALAHHLETQGALA